jgi:hypothetical protein
MPVIQLHTMHMLKKSVTYILTLGNWLHTLISNSIVNAPHATLLKWKISTQHARLTKIWHIQKIMSSLQKNPAIILFTKLYDKKW